MVLCCALILLQAVRGNVSKSFVSREQLDSVLKVLWPAVAAVALMHFIGLCRLRALHRFLHALGRGHSWVSVLTLGIGIPVVTFLVFEKWFLVPMPKGH